MSRQANNLSHRGFLVAATAAATMRSLPRFAAQPAGRRILKLVYDKSLGMMRAVERVVY